MKKSELRAIIKEELLKENVHLPAEFNMVDQIEDHYDGLVDILVQVEMKSTNPKWKILAKSLRNDLFRFHDNATRYSNNEGVIKLK